MSYRTVIKVLAFCTIAAGAAWAAALAPQNARSAPAGLLSVVAGDVTIVRAGEATPHPAHIADLLSVGDRILTGRQSEATFLYCPESRSAKMLPESEVQFGASGLQIRKGKLGEEHKFPSCNLPRITLAGASQLQSGSLRLRGSDLILLSPSRTNIATLQPHFRWDPVDSATVYDLKLMDREERILWKQSGSATEAQYSPDAPALAWDQKYLWRVTARNGEDELTEVGTYFQVLPKEQVDRVRSSEENLRHMMEANPADNSPLFLLAFLYDENGMLDEAARSYGELARRIGSQEWVQARLTELMNKLGWQKLESAPPR